MATNSYNRGMPIIKRHKPVSSNDPVELEVEVEKVEAVVIPVKFRRRRPLARNLFRVHAKRMRIHTFFWALAS